MHLLYHEIKKKHEGVFILCDTNSRDVVRKFYKMCDYHQKNIIKAKHEPSELLMMLRDQKSLKDCMGLALHIIFAMTGDEISYKTCQGFLEEYQIS